MSKTNGVVLIIVRNRNDCTKKRCLGRLSLRNFNNITVRALFLQVLVGNDSVGISLTMSTFKLEAKKNFLLKQGSCCAPGTELDIETLF